MDSVKAPSVDEDDTDKQKQSSFSKLFKKKRWCLFLIYLRYTKKEQQPDIGTWDQRRAVQQYLVKIANEIVYFINLSHFLHFLHTLFVDDKSSSTEWNDTYPKSSEDAQFCKGSKCSYSTMLRTSM